MDRRKLMEMAGASCAFATARSLFATASSESDRPPNFILILCDNLGYGDIGCYGATKQRTRRIDRMAAEGMRFTSFYSASGVCTASRASLMTGCYPRRVNLHISSTKASVLMPADSKGLHPDEVTLAEVLKARGYVTACIGKWHLGDQPAFLPTRQGFDTFFGIPYSEDMVQRPDRPWPPLPLMRDEKVIEAPVDQNLLTQRYTEEAIRFFETNKAKPFFLYLPQAMPGSTQESFASPKFRGRSANGTYGDTIEELDWSTGALLDALKRLGLDDRTLVVWTSDNGTPNRRYGSNAPLSGWGYSTDEGGMRMPCVARWPDRIPSGRVCDELCTMMDWMPTFARLAGTAPPGDRVVDGKDIWPLLSGRPAATSPYEVFYYYQVDQLQAVRSGQWKLCLARKTAGRKKTESRVEELPLRLYDLKNDLGETRNVVDKHPDVAERLMGFVEKAREDLGDTGREGKNQRPAGWVANPKPQVLP